MIKKIIQFFLFLFISLNVYAQDSDLWKIYINDFSGGQNSYDIPHVIESNQGSVVKNATINRKGRLSKRKGNTLFATDLSNTKFTGVGRFTPSPTNDYMMVASGGSVLRSSSTASWFHVTTAMSSGKDTEFVQCNDWLAVLNGVDYPGWYSGTVFYEGAYNVASPPVAKYGAWFKNYLFLAHGSVETDWVWFSSNLEPRDFDVLDVFKVNTGDGQAIQGLLPFKENEMIIYKERSAWVLDITGSTPLTDWSLQPVLENIGCIAPRSIVNMNNDQWFLSSEPIGVRSLVRTAFDKIHTSLISTPVQDIFDGTGEVVINRTYIDKAAAVVFDNKYLISIATGTSTVNNLVLVFDGVTNGWSQIDGWYVEDWVVFDNKLYYIDSLDGRVLRAYYGNNDQASGPIVTVTEASGPTTRGVAFQYESKSYDLDSPELYKLPEALAVVADSSGDYDLNVYINLDDGGWQTVGTMNLAGESSNLPQILPFDLSSEKLARETFPLNKYGEFKEIQVGFTQEASDETVELRSYTLFGRKLQWRRDD